MRVVLDTNVVVSAAFFGGPPRRVVDAWIEGRLELVVSPSIFDEYPRVCERLRERYPGTDYQPLLTAILAHGALVPDPDADVAITDDPDDGCALAAGATVARRGSAGCPNGDWSRRRGVHSVPWGRWPAGSIAFPA